VRNFVFGTISVLLGLLVPIGLAEVVLRFLPVSEGLRAVAVDAANPVFHFTPDRERVWSHGWNFDIVNRVRVNNAGYVNDQDYDIEDARPLLAVVGDSYVEAAMVPYSDTLHGRLAAGSPNYRAYSFAASGAPLSQYLVWAHEARVKWRARALVVVVVGNDFDESLAVYKSAPGFHHYIYTSDGSRSLKRFDYRPSPIRLVMRRSALARYLLLNLQAPAHLQELFDLAPSFTPPAKAAESFGNTSADAGTERVDKSKAAIRAFLSDIRTYAGWQPEQVLFVVDGIRYPSSAGRAEGSYFAKMRSYFIAEARRAGFESIDMDPWFFECLKAGPVQFEFPTDGHWNAIAHNVAADAVFASEVFNRWRRSEP
jgi:hypothetical protein